MPISESTTNIVFSLVCIFVFGFSVVILLGMFMNPTDTNASPVSEMGMLNPDGKSYTFDSRGAGYGRGEGVATIVLKRLDQALENG